MRVWLAGIVVVSSVVALPGQEPAKGRIRGRAVDALAEPMVAAEITVAPWQQPDHVLARTRTDGDGWFVAGNLPLQGSLLVRASAPGKVGDTDWVSLSAASPEGSAQLRLWDAGSIAVRVLDEDGKPLADSSVCAAYDDSRLFGFDPQAEGRTDADGKVTLSGVPLGRIHVRAWAPGFGVGEQLVELRDTAATEVRLQRGKGSRLEVEVKGLSESAEATVRVIAYGVGSAQCLPRVLVRGAVDADGRWCATGLPPDWEYLVSVHSDDLAFAPRDQKVKGSTDQRLEFAASRPQHLVLHGVLHGPEGEPLAGERLECRASNGGERKQAVTAADGSFAIESPLAPGSEAVIYLVGSAWALAQPKPESVFHDLRSLHWHEFDVDVQAKLELRAVAAAEVRGVLVDPEGKPVPMRRVTLQERGRNRMPEWMAFRYGTTARDGAFAFTGLRAPDCELRVGADDMGSAISATFTLKDGQRVTDLRVVLAPLATIGGTVRDGQGAPVPGARVWLRDWDFARNQQMSGSVIEVLADRQGRYRFTDVVPGGHYLEIVEGFHDHRVRTDPFEIEAGKGKQVDLTLQ